MSEVKGHFREFQGKRVWIPTYQDHRQAAQEAPKAPKNIKPLVMPPPQALKPIEPSHAKHAPVEKKPEPPKWGAPHKPEVYQGEKPSTGLPWAKKDAGTWTPPPKKEYTPEEKLAYLLKHNPKAKLHPKKDEAGEDFYIKEPSVATGPDTWDDPSAVALFTPGCARPKSLNGVALKPWTDHPTNEESWVDVEGQDHHLVEPPLPEGKAPAAGVVIEEPDGRVWVIHPSNGFGGYSGSFPKGHQDNPQNLQATAIREAFEESGLKVEITGYLMDVHRSTTTARYYTAKRVGGTPTDCGWETQAVALVPRSLLYQSLNSANDHGIAEALGAGPKPEPPKWMKAKWDKDEEADFQEPEPWWNDLPF